MTSKAVAIIGLVALLAGLLARRRRVIDLTCTGVFFASHIVFVVVGIISAPWLIDSQLLHLSYPYLHWEVITDHNLILTIVIVIGGLLVVLLGHFAAESLHRAAGASSARWGPLLNSGRLAERGVSIWALTVVTSGMILVAAGFLSFRLGAFLHGVRAGYMGGNIQALYDAREQMQGLGRIYYFIIFNGLPFVAVLSWLLYRTRPTRFAAALAVAVATVTTFFLISTFEKRPLVLFLITILLAHLLGELHKRGGTARSFQQWIRRVPWRLVGVAATVPLMVLILLYFLGTRIAGEYGFSATALALLGNILILRVFGRLAAMPIFYVSYYPSLHPFYGLTNVGLVSSLTGTPLYRDTVEVWRYFSDIPFGSGAIGAVTDFYASFGWIGWSVGCLLLGFMLYSLDRWLATMRPTLLNRAFFLMMLVFSSTLSQASLPRALSTYGGVVFVVLWAVLSRKFLPANRTVPNHGWTP